MESAPLDQVQAAGSAAPGDPSAFAQTLADELGEADLIVRRVLKRMVKRLGIPICAELLQATRDVEDGGGIWSVRDRTRRTRGGVFFALLRDHSPKARAILLHTQDQERGVVREGAAEPPFTWAQRGELTRETLLQPGEAMTAKLTLVGRPGKVVERKEFVVTSMELKAAPSSLPKGLPVPTSTRAVYTVYIATKQWRKVAELIRDPSDVLIVEGHCMPDPESGGIAVLAQSATTRSLQKQKVAAMKGEAPGAPEPAAPPPPPVPAAPPPPSDDEQIRAILQQRLAAGQTLEAVAGKTGLPLKRLQDFSEGRPTTLTPAQVQTFLQKLRQGLRT